MARIPDEEIERLAEARGVQLKRHGADLIGLCPFHEDHSPLSLHKYLYTHAGTVTFVALGAACPGGSTSAPTPNNYLYSGEQFDPDLNLYYNRARYLNTNTGRFFNMDSFEGNTQDPLSLHKYLYSNGDPVDGLDPSGHLFVSNFIYGNLVHQEIGDDFEAKVPFGISNTSLKGILGIKIPGGLGRPDLTDPINHLVYEIKPVGSESLGVAQVAGYAFALTQLDPERNVWLPGELYFPPTAIRLNTHAIALVSPPVLGVIIYEVIDDVEILAIVSTVFAYDLAVSFGAATATASLGFAF